MVVGLDVWLLSLSGPILLLTGNVPAQFGPPLLPWVSILLDLWCVTSLLLGIVAIVVAQHGAAEPPALRSRLRSAGLMLAILAIVTDGCLFLLWLLTPMSF